MSRFRCPSKPPIGLSAAQPPLLTCAGRTTSHYWAKSHYFICLLTMAFPSGLGWAFSLTIPHGMHLEILTHLSLFWMVCHPSRIFPPKEFEREPQNRLSHFPHRQTKPSLTSDPWPPLLYWLGTSWWCLNLVCAPLPCVSIACLLLMRLSWLEDSFMHSATCSWPLVAWMSLWAFVLYVSLPSWAGPYLIVGFSFSNKFFTPSVGLLALLPYHFVILVVILFDLCLLGLF